MTFLLNITPQLLGMEPSTSATLVPPEWRIQARCEQDDVNTCVFLQQVSELIKRDKNDGKSALAALKKMFEVTKTGQPLESFYDKKECHVAHEFSLAGVSQKIWRIRKSKIRIYFYYCEGKVVYLTAAMVKRKDKLSAGEIKQLEDEVKLYTQAKQNQSIQLVSPKKPEN